MPLMFQTFEVLKDVKSRDVSDEHPQNISSMFPTLDVSNDAKSIDFGDEQP